MVLDLSRLDKVREIGLGRVRAEAGARLARIDQLCQADSAQELRFHPSTLKMGTIGGFVAGGSSGVGSITWGILRDRGNILGLRVITMEDEPRAIELRGDAIQKVNHAYGTNGVITEVEMPLAPAYPWVDLIVGFDDLMTRGPLRRCARAPGRADQEADHAARGADRRALFPAAAGPHPGGKRRSCC